MILCANKVDLVHLRKVSEEQGRELAEQLKVRMTSYQGWIRGMVEDLKVMTYFVILMLNN